MSLETVSESLARQLVLDELFDLSLYQKLHATSGAEVKKILSSLIPVETRHFHFWQEFFNLKIEKLDALRRIKLFLLSCFCRIFGATGVHLILEAIEIYGVRKYLLVWETYKETPLGAAVKEILTDEFEHEDAIVSEMSERKIDPEKIRSIFLGFNDGLVELLGAVSGLFAAFGQPGTVLIAGFTMAAAGSLSMTAGAYVASSSESEVKKIESQKAKFLRADAAPKMQNDTPLSSAMLVGVSHFAGSMVVLLPVLFGTKNIVASLVSGGSMMLLLSLVLAFLSGMEIKKRILLNLGIVVLAAALTYGIGLLAKKLFGITL